MKFTEEKPHPMAASETKLRLLPGHDFIIHAPADRGEEFVDLFRTTWQHLPLVDRRRIIKFWKSSEYAWQPVFELSDIWAPMDADGQVGSCGYEIKFREQSFRHFPKPAAEWIIAHELAHVYQRATRRDPTQFTKDENEDDADRIAESWGFSKLWLSLIRTRMHTYGTSLKEACDFFRKSGYIKD